MPTLHAWSNQLPFVVSVDSPNPQDIRDVVASWFDAPIANFNLGEYTFVVNFAQVRIVTIGPDLPPVVEGEDPAPVLPIDVARWRADNPGR